MVVLCCVDWVEFGVYFEVGCLFDVGSSARYFALQQEEVVPRPSPSHKLVRDRVRQAIWGMKERHELPSLLRELELRARRSLHHIRVLERIYSFLVLKV